MCIGMGNNAFKFLPSSINNYFHRLTVTMDWVNY